MRFSVAFPVGAFLCGMAACGDRLAESAPSAEAAELDQRAGTANVASRRRHQPKPGERVPQPELDAYCTELRREVAYYYHGGSPVVRLARKDGCAPLFMTACAAEDGCYAPRDQEPGMWCCAAEDEQQAAAHAPR
jgi:hypothetical protein